MKYTVVVKVLDGESEVFSGTLETELPIPPEFGLAQIGEAILGVAKCES